MKNAFRGLVALVGAFSAVIATGAVAAAAHHSSYVCSGGNIPSGSYSSVLVTGVCYIPSGFVSVTGDLTVAPGALLDATTPAGGYPPGFPPPPATTLPGIVQVGGNVRVGRGAVLFLGCDPAIGCANSTYPGPPAFFPPFIGFSNPGDFVKGNLDGRGALGVVVHSVSIGGNASLIGGGGGPAQVGAFPGSGDCLPNFSTGAPALVPPPALWLADPTLANGGPTPVYSDFEDTSIGGNLMLIGLQTCWMGSLRNKVGGNVLDLNNTMGDPDGNEVVNNWVSGNMVCHNNNHVVQFGESGGAPNLVSGNAVGECGFNVFQPDINFPNFDGTGGPQPISVKG
jgi:hypothetical protein